MKALYALEIDRLSKSYGDFRLREVSLALPRGTIMGLIGPNGAGKTTVIKLLLNLVHRESGGIRIFGLDIPKNEIAAKRRIGFVHDTPHFFEYLTLRRIADTVAPFYPDWEEGAFRRLLEEFDLPPSQKFSRLSRGMKMKFSLALALAHNADLLILDEPTSGLDPVFRRDLLKRLSGFLQDEGKSVLFSTHITSDLERTADYVTFLKDGAIVFSAAKDDILNRYAVVKGGPELLAAENRRLFAGVRKREFVVQALTADAPEVRRRLGSAAAIEKATLEDIMVYLTRETADA
jgi:ABC-2 type transport system ATP-binding protein